jgi:hypothetical protein
LSLTPRLAVLFGATEKVSLLPKIEKSLEGHRLRSRTGNVALYFHHYGNKALKLALCSNSSALLPIPLLIYCFF